LVLNSVTSNKLDMNGAMTADARYLRIGFL